jgi:hypothetical protein
VGDPKPKNLADLLKSRFGDDPAVEAGEAQTKAKLGTQRMSDGPPTSLFSLPNPYLSVHVQAVRRRAQMGEPMGDMITLRNATRRPVLVGAHFLLPGHTVTLQRAVAGEARKAHPGAFDIVNEEGVVVPPISLTTFEEAAAAAAGAGAMEVLEHSSHGAGGAGGSGFGPASDSTPTEASHDDSGK